MNDIIKFDDKWLPIQNKVFTRWVSMELFNVSKIKITDITKDLANGSILIDLAQVLTHHKCSYKKGNTDNCDKALKMFEDDGMKIVGITGKDITNHNEELILRLVWKLICHYSIRDSFLIQDKKINGFLNENEPIITSKLLSWAVNQTEKYSNVFSFKPYELAMCALIDSFYPEKINYDSLNYKDYKGNFDILIKAMNELRIPCFIFPDDVLQNGSEIDQKVLLTQLAVAKLVLEGQKSDDNKTNDKSNDKVKEKKVYIHLTKDKFEPRIEEKPHPKVHTDDEL